MAARLGLSIGHRPVRGMAAIEARHAAAGATLAITPAAALRLSA